MIAKAIALDERHGISDRFLSYFKQLDDKYQVRALSPSTLFTSHVR